MAGALILAFAGTGHAAESLEVAPPEIAPRGPSGRRQLLVSASFAGGRTGDLTRAATYKSSQPAVAEVSPTGLVVPRGDGEATIEISANGQLASVKVVVSDFATPTPVDFRTDVMAAFSRAGCNQGACHGSPQGKGGFRLSLRGYHPPLDLESLVREGASRRTNPLAPEESLILLKGSGRMPHQGGVRFHKHDWSYQTLAAWISAGCPDSATPRKLRSLEVLPPSRKLPTDHPRQQVVALAHFEDGSVVDVTSQAVFSTNMDSAYAVSDTGLVEFSGTAEASILVRYLEQVRSVKLTYVADDPNYAFQGPPPANYVDEHVFAQQRSLQLAPAPLATDAVFLRRVYLDLIGTLPTEAEAREFLDSTAADKRARLIDKLLERDEFASFWALKWADVMRGNRNTVSQRGVHSLHRYLVDHFAADRPFDALAREMLTSLGNTLQEPAASFYRIARTPEDAAEGFGQLFLGVRLGCARCHNHPFEALTQTDYYGLAAFFARVKLKGKQFGRDDEIVYLVRQGEVQHPLTRKNLEPVVFGVAAGTLTPDDDRREKLADWLTGPGSRQLARSTVNRIWAHLLGRGIVEPVDDFRDTNPPANPELLDALSDDFIRGGYRFRPLIRTIANSRAYQLSAERGPQSPQAADPARYFTRATVRMLTAEQVIDAISAAVGVPEEFAGYPVGTRAIELAEGAVDNHFLMAFSRPIRDAACDCAREEDPSLGEALHLLNNSRLVERISSPESRLGKWLAEKRPPAEIIESLYLCALSRRPTAAEIKLAESHLADVGDSAEGLRDLQHALLNASEFLLRH
ncbi:MAG: DUF1549 and DUF1553 domain-containing protein [Pirellulaceae bacterium]|nr:DUF1549 and DUF1553 domain-containing protein [Pirellulaceae bacterium]